MPSDVSTVAVRRQDLGVPLATLLEAWSVDAINLQLGFAIAHEQELARLADALEPVAVALGPIAAALFPPRLEVETHEVSTRVRVVVDRTRRGGITLVPLNLGYDLRYGTTATRESRPRSSPSTMICPRAGSSTRERRRTSVVLPEALGPMTPKISPASTESERSRIVNPVRRSRAG